jgi:uncharacterized protein YehS (DUF1456 family)
LNANDILRQIRYALNLRNPQMLEVFKLGEVPITQDQLLSYLTKEGDEGFVGCNTKTLGAFLDGLIIYKRGPRPEGAPAPAPQALDNNLILRKIKIALEHKDTDILAALQRAGFAFSKTELSALFRKKGHKHYRECKDQILRNYIRGIRQG